MESSDPFYDADWEDQSYTDSIWRFLAKEKDPVRVDYSVLSVGVMTLGLIMVVEVVRHRIDHAAHGRPFFMAVLEMVYSELATLGIVELFLYILASYYEGLDKKKYAVFADVHFALFYTAIFNAFQSVLLAFASTSVSKRIWVQTEMLELNHYVEIREEFEQVQRELNAGYSSNSSSTTNASEGKDESENQSHVSTSLTHWRFRSTRTDVGKFCKSLLFQIKHPTLRQKYNHLLLQVRFHELRVHFLQAYKLPLKLKISNYLMRSEQNVLMKLVHVSAVAWLLLTGAVNLLYYVLGMASYQREDTSIVGKALIVVFFLCMGVFVLVAVMVYAKMKRVFRAIMVEKTLWDVHNVEQEERERLSEQQLALFWGGDPKLVIAAIQFMQFGYALTLSVVIVFWQEIDDGTVPMYIYLVVIAVCYGVFVLVTAQAIPRFTLCTSLGQLVDKKRLYETLADHLLEEAKRKHLERMYLERIDEGALAHENAFGKNAGSLLTPAQQPGMGVQGVEGAKQAGPSEPVAVSDQEIPSVEASTLMPELVRLDTDSLRDRVSDVHKERTKRATRRKAKSDGVAAMAAMERSKMVPFTITAPLNVTEGSRGAPMLEDVGEPSWRHRRRKSVSDDVMTMAHMHPLDSAITPGPRPALDDDSRGSSSVDPHTHQSVDSASLLAELVKLDTDSLRANLPENERHELSLRQMGRANRRTRRKTRSEGVAAMAAMGGSEGLSGFPRTPSRAVDDTFLPSSHQAERRDDTFAPFETRGEEPRQKDSQSDQLQERRRRRKRHKAVTDGVALMARLHRADQVALSVPEAVPEGCAADHEDEVNSNTSRQQDEPTPSANVVSFASTPQADNAINQEQAVTGIRSNLSDDDGHSDAGDVPDVDPSLLEYHNSVKHKVFPGLGEWFLKYFLSKRYVVVSNVFGTMVAFFLVGERIERFMHTEGIASSKFVSFHFPNVYSFWALFSWFVLFLCGDSVIFGLIKPWSGAQTFVKRKASIAAALDITLVAVCLCVLIVAEVQRCNCVLDDVCDNEDERKNTTPAPCCCLPFGSRLYGGLGTIEPYTSLIALRIFRHWFAKRLLLTLEKNHVSESRHHETTISKRGLNIDPFAVFGETNHSSGAQHGHGHGHGEEKGTAAELWRAAVSEHPEIVAKHGEFSGEVLKAMLGIHFEQQDTLHSESVTTGAVGSDAKIFALGKEYSGLAPEAQEYIMAGKLGRSVKHANSFNLDAHDVTQGGGAIPQELQFELDADAPEKEAIGDTIFSCPNAPLVRSMRRCDRMLLPILDKWTLVDVVLTRFEIVYFDASDIDEHDLRTEGIRQALSATKGGKGLRLCDVAVGRRVVGHLELSEIESIAVERHLPIEGDAELPSDIPESSIQMAEYWQHSQHKEVEVLAHAVSWKKIKEDRLRIQTVNGPVLYLRFYSDLEFATQSPDVLAQEKENGGPIFKDNAFQWAQTIGRFCGPDQLKQSLPHFGDDTDDELRDYLVVYHDHEDNDTKKGHRRLMSGDPLPRRKLPLRRIASFADIARPELPKQPPPYHRSASVGEADSPKSAHFNEFDAKRLEL